MSSSEPDQKRQPRRQFAVASLAAGAVLLSLSFVPALSSGKERWSTEKARDYQQASLEIQELTHELVNKSPDDMSRETSTKYRDAMDNYESLRSQLEDARSRRGTSAAVLRVLGAGLMIAGILSFLSTVRRQRKFDGVHLRRVESPATEAEVSG
jgi:hypothetical protein